MKKKEIEKVPYSAADGTKRKYQYVATAFVSELKNEDHLFVEIYRNEIEHLEIPYLRMVFTKKDWGLFWPQQAVWSSAGIRDEYGKNVWGKPTKKNDTDTFMDERDEDVVWKFCEDVEYGFSSRRWNSWTDRLKELTDSIRTDRREKMYEGRRKRLKEREANTPPLPDDLEKWAEKSLFSDVHFLYYKRKGRHAQVACSACGIAMTLVTQKKDSFEGMFERSMGIPQHNKSGKCPFCGATGTWKAKGKTDGVYEMDKYCFVGQPYKENGVVIRYVQIGKIFRLTERGAMGEEMEKAEESFVVEEIARRYLVPGKKAQTDFHKYSSYSGNFWDDCNLYGMDNITIKAAPVYEKTFELIKGTDFKYSGAKELSAGCREYNLMDYMERYTQFPQLEMFSKAGLYGVASQIVENKMGIIKDRHAKRPEDFLGIYKERLTKLKQEKGDTEYLRAMQAERATSSKWTDRELFLVKEAEIRKGEVEFINKHLTIRKMANYVEKITGVRLPSNSEDYICTRGKEVIKSTARTYLDYLNMREARGYDLHNTVFLLPKELRRAHNQMVAEVNAEKISERELEVRMKFPNIQKNYRKLRNRFFYEDENYLIRPAKSAEEIVKEGRFLHHCVGGNNYLKKHDTGESYILLLRRKGEEDIPYITVEIKGEKIAQWYGENDKKPDKSVIDPWLRKYMDILKDRNMKEFQAAG